MPSALSLDLRQRVVACVEAGTSCRKAAARFGVGVASAICWHARFRGEGQVAAKPVGGDRSSHGIEAHATLILQPYEARPDIFLRELHDQLRDHGIKTSLSGLSRFFARHGITRKKGRSTRPSRSART